MKRSDLHTRKHIGFIFRNDWVYKRGDGMKIRALDTIGNIKVGEILDAVIHKSRKEAMAYDMISEYGAWTFFNDRYPKFEIVEENTKDEKQWCSVNDEKWYSLDELKQLKELFK